jgi:hypothetical protein
MCILIDFNLLSWVFKLEDKKQNMNIWIKKSYGSSSNIGMSTQSMECFLLEKEILIL